jgi:glycerophosphoryl diester phosphodiesterase
MRHRLIVAACALSACGLAATATAGARELDGGTVLLARAVLPADTFAPGPPSGAFITPANGRTPPFASQPVQGISAVLPAGRNGYWVMEDNGYGAKANSSDFLLRVYRVTPRFETARQGPGTVDVGRFIQLRDPGHQIAWPIVNPSGERFLTGADFDIESFRKGRDGTLWFGDEFGPFLLHTSASGRVLEAPIPLPGVKSPDNPTLAAGEAPTLGSSKGFEGMAQSPDRRVLYPMLEGALLADTDQRRRLINEFSIRDHEYTGRQWAYKMDAPTNAIGDFTQLDKHRFLVIERDQNQGAAAAFKRIYEVDFRNVGADGFLVKRQAVDLLDISDPNLISVPGRPGDIGLGGVFSMPFVTIESVLPLEDHRLLVINDNNYPFSAGRNPTRPDDTEFVVLQPATR